jgi:hypothetical protein
MEGTEKGGKRMKDRDRKINEERIVKKEQFLSQLLTF